MLLLSPNTAVTPPKRSKIRTFRLPTVATSLVAACVTGDCRSAALEDIIRTLWLISVSNILSMPDLHLCQTSTSTRPPTSPNTLSRLYFPITTYTHRPSTSLILPQAHRVNHSIINNISFSLDKLPILPHRLFSSSPRGLQGKEHTSPTITTLASF